MTTLARISAQHTPSIEPAGNFARSFLSAGGRDITPQAETSLRHKSPACAALMVDARTTIGALCNGTIGTVCSANGMGLMWDGGQANYLCMGAGIGSAWSWQWNKSTGALVWLGGSSQILTSIDPGGSISAPNYTAAGRYTSNSNDQASFYSPTGGMRADGGGNCIYAPNGSMYAGGDMNCSTLFARAVVRVNPQNGIQYDPPFLDQGNNSFRCCISYGTPNWGNFTQNYYHVGGSWVGWNIQSSDGKELRWEGQGGAATANSWGVWSDRRLKTDLAVIDNPRSRVANLIGYTYTSTNSKHYDGSPVRRAGLVAQDALLALAEAVTSQPEEGSKLTGEFRYSMDYAAIVALLVNDNNALAARLSALEAEVTQLKGNL